MSRITELTNAARRPVVASAVAGMCIALAATGGAVAAAPDSAPAKTSSAHASHHATSAAKKREFTRRHNPHGGMHRNRRHSHVVFHGKAVDPDKSHHRVKIVLWRNHHRMKTVHTNKHHYYRVRTHLRYGKNHLVVVAKNIGRGTVHTKLGATRIHRHGWVLHYHGHKRIAARMLKHFGWGHQQMGSLVSLWNRESGWCKTAANSSGAYGIPQALPGSKMSSAGPNWRYNAHTQMRWGMHYIKGRYGSPNGAWAHSQSTGWY